MMLALANRLRISGPLPSDVEVAETRRALQQGLDLLAREGLKTPDLRTVIWRLAQDAAETMRRSPDREWRWLHGGWQSIWPELARPSEECRAVEQEIDNEVSIEALRCRQGSLVYLRTQPEPLPRVPITDPTAGTRMLVVLGWLRYVRGSNRRMVKRDQRIFIDMAAGDPPRVVKAKHSDELPRRCSDSTIRQVKLKVLLHITRGLMPYSKQLTFNGRSRNLR